MIFPLPFIFQYPYIPAHITKPKEHKRLFLAQLPEKGRSVCVEASVRIPALCYLLIDVVQSHCRKFCHAVIYI